MRHRSEDRPPATHAAGGRELARALRGRHVFAAGLGVLMSTGGAELVLRTRSVLAPGNHTLVLVRRHGSRNVTVSEPLVVARG